MIYYHQKERSNREWYLEVFQCLPQPKDAPIGENAVREANRNVKRVLEAQHSQQPHKKRFHTNFTNTDRAQIGKYATENGNSAAQRPFKTKFPNLGENTVRDFKKNYLARRGPACFQDSVQKDMETTNPWKLCQ